MANPEHLEILKRGVKAWNKWRKEKPEIMPDLHSAELNIANLRGADLGHTNLVGAQLNWADLTEAHLLNTNLNGADLRNASLITAYLLGADLINTKLSNANLDGADLSFARLQNAYLDGTNLAHAKMGYTIISDVDLSNTRGLNEVIHHGPSSISIDTLYKSGGNIPAAFLLSIGVSDNFIPQVASLVGAEQPIQFYSCFISYSKKDEEFARRLHSRMRDDGLRVWFAPEDVKGGEKLYEQIERAIQIHDRLLIVLSENSMLSKWVVTEIRRARKVELKENRRKLFPIRLVNFDTLQSWECFDADTGEDLAAEVRQYFIPDFSNWKEHDDFEAAFARLLRDLKAEEKKS